MKSLFKVMDNIVPSTEEISLDDGSIVDNKFIAAEEGNILIQTGNNSYSYYLLDGIYEISQFKILINTLSKLTEKDELKLYIDCHGGSVMTGMVIISAMKKSMGRIITINSGMAASMGSGIWSYGDELRLEPGSITMFHDMSTGMHGSLNSIEPKLRHIKSYMSNWIKHFVKLNLLTDEEGNNIQTKGAEYFIPYSIMKARLAGGKE